MNRRWKYNLLDLLALASAFISVYFVVSHGLLNSDILFHYERIKGLGTLLGHGQWPLVREQYGTLQGNMIYIMYPWLTLIPLLPVLFFHERTAILLLEVTIILSMYILSYSASLSSHWSKSQRLMFSLLYTAISMPSITFRGDVGLALALVFLPLVLFGLRSLIVNGKYLELLTGLLLVAYSHVPTTALLLIFLIVIAIINWPVAKLRIKQIIKVIALFITGTVFEWLPYIYLNSQNHVMSPQVPYRTPHVPYPFCSDSITMFMTLFVLVLPILLLCYQDIKPTRFDNTLFIIGAVCALMDVKYVGGVLAQYVAPLRLLQFGSRFLPFTILFWTYLLCQYAHPVNNTKAACQLLNLCVIGSLLFSMALSLGTFAISPRTNNYHRLSNFQGYLLPRAYHRTPYQFHYASEYDYAPWPAVKARHFCHWSTLHATSHGLVIQASNYHDDTLPITVYHGFCYRFKINHHVLSNNQINWRLTSQRQLLTLNHSPQRTSTIRITSATLDK